jgi:hypothetical protein
MALTLADRVRETTTTTGTGAITLGGAVLGFVAFSAVLANGATTYYAIVGSTQWEVGLGTYVSGSNTLQRTTVFSSSNGGALVSFTSGTKNVILTQPSERAVYVDGTTVVAANGATVPNSLLANSSITINGVTIALGGSSSVVPAPNPLVNYTLTTPTINSPTITGGTLTDNISQGTVVTADSAFDALRVTQNGAGNAFVVEDATTPDGSPFVITANGSVVVGYTSTINAGGATNPKLEVLGTTPSLSTIASGIYSSDTTPASYYFLKSRSGALGTNTIVQSGDQIGQVVFSGADGTTFIPAASIVAEVDTTPGTSDMPGRLVFKTTADGAATPTTAVTIDNAQRVGVGAAPVASKGTFQVGTIGYTDTGVVAGLSSSVAGYNQVILQNTNAGATASVNFNISNDGGTATTNYGEFGMNSSGFTGTGSFSQPGYVYLVAASTDLAIGTYGSNNIRFVINSGTTDAAIIDTSGRFAIGATPSAVLTLKAGTATASTAPLKFTSGTILTTAEAGVIEYDGTAFYADIAASTRTTIVAQQSLVLNTANSTLANQTAAQKIFNNTTNGQVTLPVGTYFFECFYSLSSLSATSGSFGFALGGTATFTQQWRSEAQKGTATLATATATQTTYSTAANTTLATASTNTIGWAYISGVVNVTAAGTLIPQVSVTTTAAPVVGVGSYFKINAVSPTNSTTNVTVGNWS